MYIHNKYLVDYEKYITKNDLDEILGEWKQAFEQFESELMAKHIKLKDRVTDLEEENGELTKSNAELRSMVFELRFELEKVCVC